MIFENPMNHLCHILFQVHGWLYRLWHSARGSHRLVEWIVLRTPLSPLSHLFPSVPDLLCFPLEFLHRLVGKRDGEQKVLFQTNLSFHNHLRWYVLAIPNIHLPLLFALLTKNLEVCFCASLDFVNLSSILSQAGG